MRKRIRLSKNLMLIRDNGFVYLEAETPLNHIFLLLDDKQIVKIIEFLEENK